MKGSWKIQILQQHISQNFQKDQVCRSCKQRGHIARNCPEKSKSVTCELCGESGHDEENCDVKKYQRSKTEKSDKYRKAYAALGVCDDGFCVPGY